MYLQDPQSALKARHWNLNDSVKAPWPQKGRIEYIDSVRGCYDLDVSPGSKPIHLR